MSQAKNFQLFYPDGSRKHISTAQRDDLCLSGLAREISPRKYAFTGQQHTLHSMSELGILKHIDEIKKRFLPGSFIFEHDGRRIRELMETAEACALRLNLYQQQMQVEV